MQLVYRELMPAEHNGDIQLNLFYFLSYVFYFSFALEVSYILCYCPNKSATPYWQHFLLEKELTVDY
jgi:hypothetical protein